MKKQPQVTEQTRANLRQAFWELYAERPVEKISVREITDRAGYNRATFYLYYHDVYELLDEIEDTVLGNIERLVQGRLLQGDRLDFSQHMGLILRLAQREEGALERHQVFTFIRLRTRHSSMLPNQTVGKKRDALGAPSSALRVGQRPTQSISG